MKPPRWIEQPRTLAALTLAFALVPAAIASVTFKAARERDAKLFDTAAEVLGEQLRLSTFKHVTFLNVMRGQWRMLGDKSQSQRSIAPPGGWMERHPHLLAVAYAGHVSETNIPIRWQEGRQQVKKMGENLAGDPELNAILERARLSSSAATFAVDLPDERLAIVEAVPDARDLQLVRGYIVGWLDLNSICHDQALPLVRQDALRAGSTPVEGREFSIGGDGDVKWTAWITRGPGFSREYGTPTPWIGFAALGLSVLPLSVLVMLATRAGKLRSALEAEQLKNQFVSTMSHEFRTPLSVILSSADLLEAHLASLSGTRRVELLTQIKSSTVRMNEMVEQVLLFGRIESGAIRTNPQPVAVAALCREIVEEVRMATQDRCEIDMEAAPNDSLQSLDTALTRSILVNVLSNAVKYSKPGSRVVFAVQAFDHAVRFLVTDEGIGIPTDDQGRLGEPFHRASNVGDTAGTGLGLAVVKRCVELCGGTLAILSKEGRGTQAVVTLPI